MKSKSEKESFKIKAVLSEGCVFFTVAVFLFYLLGKSFLPDIVPVMTFKTISSFLAFSFLIAAFNALLKAEKLSAVFRYILHFAGCMASFAVVFLGMLDLGETGAKKMILFFFAILVYIIIMLLRKLFVFLCRKMSV